MNFDQQVKLSRNLQRIAKMLDRELEKVTGTQVPFSLYTWGGQRAQYISNAPRDEIKVAMRECLDRWDQPDDPPPHQFGG